MRRYTTKSGRPVEGVYWKDTASGQQMWIVFEGPKVEGKKRNQKWRRVPSDRLEDAKRLRGELQKQARQGGPTTEATVVEVLDDYLDTLSPRLTPRTREQYAVQAAHIRRHFRGQFAEVTPFDLEAFRNALQAEFSPAYVHSVMSCLKRVCRRAIARDVIVANPFDKVPVPDRQKTQRKGKPLTPDEVERYLGACRQMGSLWYAFFLCVIDGGLRQGEACGMTWENLDGEGYEVTHQMVRNGSLEAPKDDSHGYVVLSPRTLEAIETYHVTWKQENWVPHHPKKGLIWLHEGDRPVMHWVALQRHNKALKAAKLAPRRFHDLRHTTASLMANDGATSLQVSRQLRHSDPSITQKVYSHLFEEQRRGGLRLDNRIG